MQRYISGLAVLEIMLATLLLAGLIYLVMHTISVQHQHASAENIGAELAISMNDLLTMDLSSQANGNYYLIESCGSPGLLTDVSPNYINGLTKSGVNLCDSTVDVAGN